MGGWDCISEYISEKEIKKYKKQLRKDYKKLKKEVEEKERGCLSLCICSNGELSIMEAV